MDKEIFIFIFLILLSIIISLELIPLGIAFSNADEIKCNLLWCEFTTIQRTIENKTIIIQYKECYKNNTKVNCSSLET